MRLTLKWPRARSVMSAGRLFVEVTGAAGSRRMRRAVITTTLQKILNFKISLQSPKLFNISGVAKDTKGAAACVGSDTNKLSQDGDVTLKNKAVMCFDFKNILK